MLGQLLGKYAAFIVPAFAVTVVAFAGMIAFSLNHARRWRRRYEELSGNPPSPRLRRADGSFEAPEGREVG